MKKILLADDEEIIRAYVQRALAGRGWQVTAVADGTSAVAAAKAESFDLLICDLKMPDMRGEAVIAAVRELRPAVKVIAITGSVSEVKKQLAPGVEADEVLLKPFGIDEIRGAAARLLG